MSEGEFVIGSIMVTLMLIFTWAISSQVAVSTYSFNIMPVDYSIKRLPGDEFEITLPSKAIVKVKENQNAIKFFESQSGVPNE